MPKDFRTINLQKDKTDSDNSNESDLKTIDLLVKSLMDYYQLDFSGYATASLSRRIKHLIKIFGLNGPEELISKIRNEPDFKISLVHEITVGATEFFRDPTFWQALKKDILPTLDKGGKPLKIWVSGCSTGEEIFSLTITLKECCQFDDVEILATDLDPMVIDVARKGFYFNQSFVKNSENYVKANGLKTLDYYCEKGGLGYQMDLSLLDNVTFRCNDLIQDNLVETFDMVFCRNVLIYFNQELQNSVLKKLKLNLKPGAFLCLGVKESISWLKESNQFDPIKRFEKIYRLKTDGVQS